MDDGFASVALRSLFLVIFFCNIPFVFFAGKIALICVVHQCCYKNRQQLGEDNEAIGLLNDNDDYVPAQTLNTEESPQKQSPNRNQMMDVSASF